MRSPKPVTARFIRLFLPHALFASSLAVAGLENGEVFANAEQTIGGSTNSANESINLRAVAPDPTANPPLPPTFAPATATIMGTMGSLDLTSTAGINAQFRHLSSAGTALIDFVDNLVVNAEGIAPGTDLIVEVAWTVSGSVDFNGPNRIKNRSKLLLEADGIDLDPDPDAPDPPKQRWTRDISNFETEVLDDFGPVTFEFLVQAGTQSSGNVRLRIASGVLCGAPGSSRTGNYDSGASAELNLEFVGATNVKTTDGEELYRWSTTSQSTLDYGMRDDDPPSNPVLTVGPSEGGPAFVNLSWDTVFGEFYIVQNSPDGENWSSITEVRGTGDPVEVDLFQDDPSLDYRLLSRFGFGTPNPSLVTPTLHIIEADPIVRIAWQTNQWENYELNEISPDGSTTQVEQVSGDGSAVWFDFTPSGAEQIFQIEATLK